MVFSSILCSSIDTQLRVKPPRRSPTPPPQPTHTPRNLVQEVFDPLINLRHFLPLNYYFMAYLIFSTLYCFSHKFIKRNLRKTGFQWSGCKELCTRSFLFLTILCKRPRKYKKAQFFFSFIFTCQNVVFIIYFAYGCSNVIRCTAGHFGTPMYTKSMGKSGALL